MPRRRRPPATASTTDRRPTNGGRQTPRSSGWRATIDSFGGFAVVGSLGGGVLFLIALLLVVTWQQIGAPTGQHTDVATASVSGAPGPEGIPLEDGTMLAPASTTATGKPVNGIECNTSEQATYHIHTHLSVFVDGSLRPIPAGIGMMYPSPQQTSQGSFFSATQCYYWLHVHAQDGVIHIESPTARSYTLGDFFSEWQQPLDGTHVGSASGALTIFVDGKEYHGDPAKITLGSHEDIQIDVGTVVPPERVDWSRTSL